MAHSEVKRDNYLCNWHCKHEHTNFSLTFKFTFITIAIVTTTIQQIFQTCAINSTFEIQSMKFSHFTNYQHLRVKTK
jgi:hypothetical protein